MSPRSVCALTEGAASARPAVQEKLRVIERGSDMVLAAHYIPLRGRLKATTVETVGFYPPERVDFKLVRGPVPHVAESFLLTESDGERTLRYTGELATDLWGLGERWGNAVAAKWELSSRDRSTPSREKPNAGQRRNRAALRPAAAPIVMISILLPPLPTSGPPACACRFSSSNTRAGSARRA
jgi:hypothetical protein